MDEKEPQEAKERLLAAGEKLFAEKGLSGVSIRELSNAAGTNSALISYHFGGKDGLYQVILETQFSPIGRLLDSVAGVKATPTEKIIQYARAVAAVHTKAPFLTRYLTGELVNPSRFFEPIIRKYIHRIYGFLTATFREGMASGEFRRDLDPEAASLALAGMMNFYFIARPITKHFLPGGAEQNERYVLEVVKIFLDGVRQHENQPETGHPGDGGDHRSGDGRI